MKIRVIHTGKVYVSVALPFKDAKKNPNPLQLSLLSLYGRRNRIWLPVSAYLIEHLNLKILVVTAVKLNHNGKFILLFSDGGYAKKSWQEMIPPGTALDEAQAFKSLQWIRQMSLDENCVESLANHDPDISPHEIILN